MLVAEEAPDLGDGFHDQHPRLAPSMRTEESIK
jgi:hypothetical protein